MPANESLIQSHGSPQIIPLLDGRKCELRNGCLVDAATREVLTGSLETTAFVLDHGKLTDTQRRWWQDWGMTVCDRMSSQASLGQCGSGLRRHNRVAERMEEAA
jgi:hypothetical protein